MENIKLKGSKNTRDLGGLTAAGGRKIRPCRLIRGDAPSRLTEEDARILKEKYRLKRVIDLRTSAEADERPDVVADGVEYLHVPLFAEEVIGITRDSESEKKSKDGFAVPGPPDMEALYAFLIDGEVPRAGLRRVMQAIFDTADGSVLFHCSVGKDRTGVVALLLLGLLGVPRETIYEDYLFTNVWGEADAQMYRDVAYNATGDEEIAERTRLAFLAVPAYLDSAYAAVERAGGFEKFFTDCLGFDAGEIEEFRKEVLE